jgi:hypothetical protein
MHSDEFLLTQEFLAMMLGVQRTGVTVAAGSLQRAGLIHYRRGNVTIIDRRGLLERSCECYGISKKEFDRLLGDRSIRKARSGRLGNYTWLMGDERDGMKSIRPHSIEPRVKPTVLSSARDVSLVRR